MLDGWPQTLYTRLMERVKEGDWIEVVGGSYLITAKGSIGIVVSGPRPGRLGWSDEMEDAVSVIFHYASNPYVNPHRGLSSTTFFIRVEDLKVIDEETAMKKIVAGYL